MSPTAPVRGRIDPGGRLVEADPALEALQREAGGVLGDRLALPPLEALARLARRLGIPVSRPVRVADGEIDLHLYVKAVPAEGAVEIAIASWEAEPARAPRADAAVEPLEDRARAAADWTWECDAGLVFTAVSPQARWRLGLPPDRMVGQAMTALFQLVEAADGSLPLLRGLAAQARVEGQRAALKTPPHAVFRLTAQPLFDPDGHFAGFRGAAVAEEGGRAPAPSLSAAIAGDKVGEALRGPLGSIVRQAEAIGAGDDGPLRRDYADYAHDIASAARHLLSLVDDLADLEAVERPDFAPEREPVDLGEVARRATGLFAVRAADRGIGLVRPHADASALAGGEYRRVLQIAVNLVGNAVRHAPSGSVVRVEAGFDADGTWLSVADEGAGIALEDQERVFDKFVRLDPGAGEGSGLGLYISRRLARAMGGDLALESRPGAGACFTLRLPPL